MEAIKKCHARVQEPVDAIISFGALDEKTIMLGREVPDAARRAARREEVEASFTDALKAHLAKKASTR